MNFPEQLHYTKEHEWISIDGNVATIGITEFAQGELGDIIYIDVETVGKELSADAVFGTVEAVKTVSDLSILKARVANRPLGTGTRQLFDRELALAGIEHKNIKGYAEEFPSHLAVGLEVLSGRADAGIGIRAIAATLGLSFIPLRWERFDLMIRKDRFFDKGVQLFTGLLGQQNFKTIYDAGYGYDLEFSGKMVYPAKG